MAYCMVFLPIRQASELLTRVSQQQQQMQDPINPLKVVSNSNVQKPCQREKLLNKQPLWGVLTEGPPIFYVLENVTYWNISILVIQKQLWKRGTPSEKSSFEVGTSRWYFLNIYIYIHIFSCSSWYFGEMIYLIQFLPWAYFSKALLKSPPSFADRRVLWPSDPKGTPPKSRTLWFRQ